MYSLDLDGRRRHRVLVVFLATVALLATACGAGDIEDEVRTADGKVFDLSPEQVARVRTDKVESIAAKVPNDIRDRGSLIVTGTANTGPPLRFHANDDRTIVGSEVDFAYLVADILGLRLELREADWSQNFVQIDSGAVDLFISNVTVTEERKEKYDFATYRLDNIGLEVPKGSDFTHTDRTGLAGKRIGVGSGTNQEQLLVDWNARNIAEGLPPIDIAYYQQTTDYYLALSSHRIDGFLGPNPVAIYHSATAGNTEVAATISGAGEALQAEIAALTKKDNGLIAAVHEALQHTIDNGTYQQVLDRWELSSEAVPASRVNPPGLPKEQ